MLEEDARFSPWDASDPTSFPNFPPNPSSSERQQLALRLSSFLATKSRPASSSRGDIDRAPAAEEVHDNVEAQVANLIKTQQQAMRSLAPLLGVADEDQAWQRLKPVFDLVGKACANYNSGNNIAAKALISCKGEIAPTATAADPVLLPYRRRNFESQAMISYLLGICSLVSPSSNTHGININDAGSIHQGMTTSSSLSSSSSSGASGRIDVPVVYLPSSKLAESLFDQVQDELDKKRHQLVQQHNVMNMRLCTFVDVDRDVLVSANSKFVVLFTPGVMRDPRCVSFVTTALKNKSSPILLSGQGWSFSSEEAKEIREREPDIALMFNEVESLQCRNMAHEWAALAEELYRRLAS